MTQDFLIGIPKEQKPCHEIGEWPAGQSFPGKSETFSTTNPVHQRAFISGAHINLQHLRSTPSMKLTIA